MNAPEATGVFVIQVGQETPGARIGLQPGDIVTHVDSIAVADVDALAKALAPQEKKEVADRQEGTGEEEREPSEHLLRITRPDGAAREIAVSQGRLGVRG